MKGLPNEIVLYMFRNFLDLADLWRLLQTSSELRLFASSVIQTTWKIDTTSHIKIQCRTALIALELLSQEFSFKSQRLVDKNQQNTILTNQDPELLIREDTLHKNMIRGISSYQHQYVLIKDIDLRNRIRTTVDLVFHHTVFINRASHRAFAALMVRLLSRMDTAFSCYCREITYTLADNIKAFLEFTSYKIMAQKVSFNSLSACFDLMGAAYVTKILSDSHVDCAVQRTCELLSNYPVFKRELLTNLLDRWMVSSDLSRYIRMEIEKCIK